MTNEQKLNAFMDAIGCKLIKDTDTIYRLEDHGYLVQNASREIFSTNVNGTLKIMPINDASELTALLTEKKSEWEGAYKRSADRRDPEFPAEMFPSSLLPFDIDVAYQMQEKTLEPVIWSLDSHMYDTNHGTVLSAELVVSPTRDGEQQLIAEEISYREWAITEDIPVYAPFEAFDAYYHEVFDTDDKRERFAMVHLSQRGYEMSDNLEQDFNDAVFAAWEDHRIASAEQLRDALWDTFVEGRAEQLADKLIEKAEQNGYSLTKQRLVEVGINDVCFNGKEHIKDDTSPEKTVKAAKKAKDTAERD